jgi:hypothetical protein
MLDFNIKQRKHLIRYGISFNQKEKELLIFYRNKFFLIIRTKKGNFCCARAKVCCNKKESLLVIS